MKYSTEVKVDENGDYFIEIPEDIAKELGWEIGDDIKWTIEGDSVILRKEVKSND